MFTNIDPQRVAQMTSIESRWLDNVKKAFADSDYDFETNRMADDCIETLFKGIDAAKKLRLSLLNTPGDLHSNNRARFIEFLELEIPSPDKNGRHITLKDIRNGLTRDWSVAEILYEIRCMIHENENLNESEPIDYHILLRWWDHGERFIASQENSRLVINARLLWRRLREILSKFIMGIEALEAMANSRGFSMTVRPERGSIQPTHRTKTDKAEQ